MNEAGSRPEGTPAAASLGTPTTARRLLIAVSGAAAIAASGCGDSHRAGVTAVSAAKSVSSQVIPSDGASGRRAAPPGDYLKNDRDEDNDDREHPLARVERFDTLAPQDYGREASGAERRAIANAVRRYYAAAAAGDSATACALLSSRLARGLAEGPGGRTCATGLMTVLAGQRTQLRADDVATMTIVDVRVEGGAGIVTVGFRIAPSGRIQVARERGAWKVNALLDTEST